MIQQAKRKVSFFFYELKSFLLISPKVIKMFGIFLKKREW